MLINYWECKFQNCDSYYDSTDDYSEVFIYGCSHPKNLESYCHLDNKRSGNRISCILLDE